MRLFKRQFSAAAPPTRWGASGWEAVSDHSVSDFMHSDTYGNYFRVPNPATVSTKLICTLGPATSSKPMIEKLLSAGMSCVRLNTAHGSYQNYDEIITTVRECAQLQNRICPIMLDTKGPEIRVGKVHGDLIEIAGQSLITVTFADPLTQADILSNPNLLYVNYNQLGNSCKMGDVVLLDNGRIALNVTQVQDVRTLQCRVITGGHLKSNKGVNLPGCEVFLPHVTPKDRRDVEFAVSRSIEYIAHSFTRSAEGIEQVRALPGVRDHGIHIVAKIESQEGLDNFGEIVDAADGVMVARGDLGVEIPLERVCSMQKRMIRDCNVRGKFVITATEMLDSMMSNARPTRAEASDVANAVYDGSDCVMLSGETASGQFPLESVQVMQRICKEAELDVAAHHFYQPQKSQKEEALGNLKNRPMSKINVERAAFAKAAVATARSTKSEMIVVFCASPENARFVSKNRPNMPVFALCTSPKVCAQISLYQGVRPVLVPSLQRSVCLPIALSVALQNKLVTVGSQVLVLSSGVDAGDHLNVIESLTVDEQHFHAPEASQADKKFLGYTPGSSMSGP